MRGRMVTIGGIVSFVIAAGMIVTAAIHRRNDDAVSAVQPNGMAQPNAVVQHDYSLIKALVHCQRTGLTASDDPGCKAAWAEYRRRVSADKEPAAGQKAMVPSPATLAPGR